MSIENPTARNGVVSICAENKELKEQIRRLQAENEKYRDALKTIMSTQPIFCDGEPQGDYVCDLHREIAEQALKGNG